MPVPPQVPVITFYSPNKADQGLIEIWNTEVSAYVPLDEGAPHPNTREYPGYKLGKQQNIPNNHGWVMRTWVKDETNPAWWNWSEQFLSESNAHPIFIRQSRELRNTYAPKTKSEPFKSVYKLTLTNAGTGYTPGTLPTVTFSGGAGSGAAAHGVVNQDGTIAEFVLDDGGDNYTSAPTATVAAPTSGTTATVTAVIQPATAVLVAEKADQFPPDSEFYGLYLNVVRVYQTLPGPILYSSEFIAKYNVGIQYSEQEVTAAAALAAIGTPGVAIEKIDSVRSNKKTYDISAIAAYLLALPPNESVGEVNLSARLPAVLKGIEIITEASSGDGDYSESGSVTTTGENVGGRLSVRGEASASSVISFDAVPDIVESEATAVPTKIYEFFLAQPVTTDDIIAYLAAQTPPITVTAFPKFYPKRTVIKIKGSRISLTARTSAQYGESNSFGDGFTGSSSEHSEGSGTSHEVGAIVKIVETKPCIHATITPTGGGGGIVLPITATSHSSAESASSDATVTETPSFSVSYTNLAATTPTAIPTSGKYLLPSHSSLFGYGLDIVQAEVVDMADAAIQT